MVVIGLNGSKMTAYSLWQDNINDTASDTPRGTPDGIS